MSNGKNGVDKPVTPGSNKCAICGGTRAQHNKKGVKSDHSYKMTVKEKKGQ